MQLSLVEHQFLRSNFWWLPLPITDYYVKGGLFKNHIYIMITNFKKIWVTRLNQTQVMEQKAIHNKNIDVDDKQLMNLLGSKVQKHTEEGIYTIVVRQETLEFTFKLYLKIYLFNWKFTLKQTKLDISRLIRHDLIQPLINTLIITEKRCQILQKQVKDIGRQVNDTQHWCNIIKNSKQDDMNINKISNFNRDLIQQTLYNQQVLQKTNSVVSQSSNTLTKLQRVNPHQSSIKQQSKQKSIQSPTSSQQKKKKLKKKKLNFL